MLEVLSEGGVNRLSVGIQTFDDSARRLLAGAEAENLPLPAWLRRLVRGFGTQA